MTCVPTDSFTLLWQNNDLHFVAKNVATKVTIRVGGFDLRFNWPEDKAAVERICCMLETAHMLGTVCKQKEIVVALGLD